MTGQGKSAIDTLLAESFKELALKQPIEKITIKEITDKAGVIRDLGDLLSTGSSGVGSYGYSCSGFGTPYLSERK